MNLKQKVSFTCTNCNYHAFKWQGNCPECGQWNTFTESVITPTNRLAGAHTHKVAPLTLASLHTIAQQPTKRLTSSCAEWDRVVGGGLMPGSFIMLTGDPGIGKSTLLLQIAHQLAQQYQVYYFSSEESLAQVKLRAQRISALHESLLFSDSSDLDAIVATASAQKPDVIIIDSIQNCYLANQNNALAAPGGIAQLRDAGFRLMRLAKEENICVIATGHITKEGIIAGPKTLEHMVDGVFYLQGEEQWDSRILRAVKNRFGSINEIGFFTMNEQGMQEIPDINQHMVQEATNIPGSALVSYTQGTRPLLLEVQALTIPSKFGMPQRVITGADHKHIVLIAAILEKYLNVKLSAHDIFFKVSGGIKIRENSADLGIALALLSSYFQKAVPEKSLALGEVSLTGVIKPINRINAHVQEASKFGLNQLLLAKNQKLQNPPAHAQYFSHMYELLSLFE